VDINIKLNPYQADFLLSDKRYPCLCSGIGTGKTYILLLKVVKSCQEHPGSVWMVVRKEYSDLRDSTIKDFKRYFQIEPDSNKEFKFANGSVIMFRHGGELAVLKNLNLSGFAIEQAEEFETEEVFTMLRDRLRNPVGERKGLVIANACGHNWIWKLWIHKPEREYHGITATTFDNMHNLPADFIADLKRMEIDAPNHYKQYILNDFEETDSGDRLLTTKTITEATVIQFDYYRNLGRILAVDVARFGDCETVFCILEKCSDVHLIQIHQETWRDKDLMQVCGKILDLKRSFDIDTVVIDDVGMGGGVTDRLREQRYPITAFIGGAASTNPLYSNLRSDGFFIMKELLEKRFLKILPDDKLCEQLSGLKYKFISSGKKAMVGKDELRREGLLDPGRADALSMACCYASTITRKTHAPEELRNEANKEFVLCNYDVLA